MNRTDWMFKPILLAIALFLGMIALRPYVAPEMSAADSGRFDYVLIVSPLFIYKGNPGVLALDKRNGNLWFIAKNNDNMTLVYKDPVFIVRIPFEKMDQTQP